MNRLLKNILIALCVYVIIISTTESKSKKKQATTLEQIKKELSRFVPVLNIIRKNEGDIYVRFSKTVADEENSANRQYNSFVLGSSSIFDVANSTDNTKLDEETLEMIFLLAGFYNSTAVVSSEKYARDGSLTSRQFHVEDVTIDYNNGSTKIVYKNIAEHVQREDEKALDSYVSLMKGYELPVEVQRQVYNREGELEKDEFTKYEPKKVKIVKTNMQLNMQLLCAEVLKRSFLLKNETSERMSLLEKFLSLKHPYYSWKGESGEPTVTIKNTTLLMKAVLDKQLYTITGRSIFS